ncbi:MAG: hypothetical protein HYV76_00920 [Candidatus Vogelbacteria bacterium]|nr:hypothetical protein [Candidatus Vogelbacteria bacterium]
MRTLPILSLVILLALIALNGFFAYELFLKDKLAANKVFSPQAYIDRGLQVVFEAKGKENSPPIGEPSLIATTTEQNLTTKATTTKIAAVPLSRVIPLPTDSTLIKQALTDLRVVAGQLYATVSSYYTLCVNGVINDHISDELARIVKVILSDRDLPDQIEAGVSCVATVSGYRVSVSLSDGSNWCVSNLKAGAVCAP